MFPHGIPAAFITIVNSLYLYSKSLVIEMIWLNLCSLKTKLPSVARSYYLHNSYSMTTSLSQLRASEFLQRCHLLIMGLVHNGWWQASALKCSWRQDSWVGALGISGQSSCIDFCRTERTLKLFLFSYKSIRLLYPFIMWLCFALNLFFFTWLWGLSNRLSCALFWQAHQSVDPFKKPSRIIKWLSSI